MLQRRIVCTTCVPYAIPGCHIKVVHIKDRTYDNSKLRRDMLQVPSPVVHTYIVNVECISITPGYYRRQAVL